MLFQRVEEAIKEDGLRMRIMGEVSNRKGEGPMRRINLV